jgi:1-acyl-sn-glycerol-3-phosphate acyltransferase
MLLPTLLVWAVICGTFGQIYHTSSREAAWRRFRSNSLSLGHSSGLYTPVLQRHPAADKLIRQQTPAIYVLNHFPVALMDTVAIPWLGVGRCRILAACQQVPVYSTVYRNLGSIPVLPGGGNTQRVLDHGLAALRGGESVVIFGEGRHAGSKQRWDEVVDMQLGAFLLSVASGSPIVPVALCDPIAAYGLVRPQSILGLALPGWGQRFDIKMLAPLWPADFYNEPASLRDATVAALNAALKGSPEFTTTNQVKSDSFGQRKLQTPAVS